MPKKPWVLCRIAALFILSAALATGCRQETSGKSFGFPLLAEPRQLDPQVCTDAASIEIVNALFEGLAALDKNGNALPAAATWSVSEDGLVYTFTLKDNVWSDNSPVTSHDYVYGIQRAVMPSTRSELAKELFSIKNARQINHGSKNISELGVRALDDKRFSVTLTAPDKDFIKKTAFVPFMPCKQSFFESTGGRYGLDTEYILSNGAFYLKSWEHGKSLVLRKHEGYFNSKNIMPASVRYVIGGTDNPVKRLSEELLDAAPIETEQLKAAKDAGLEIVEHRDTIRMLWFNNGVKALSNAKIRCALRDSIEWDVLYSQFDNTIDIPAQGYLAPDTVIGADAYRTPGNILSPKPLGRKALESLTAGLTQAGLNEMPSLTILCADDQYSAKLARYIAQSWQKNLSLYFAIERLSRSELAARVKVGNYQIAIYEFTARSAHAIDALRCFAGDTAGNYSHFDNKAYNELLKSGAASREQCEQSEAMLWKQCPSVPLSFKLRYFGISKDSSGIVIRPFGGGAYGAVYDFSWAGKT